MRMEELVHEIMAALASPLPPSAPRESQVRDVLYALSPEQIEELMGQITQEELTEMLYCLGVRERPRIENPFPVVDIATLRMLLTPRQFVCPKCGALNTENDHRNYFCRPGGHWFKKGDVRAYEERRALERGTSD